ncbi:MAG: acyl-homoserine-lactone synthase [Enterobacterales bacterium endosymbiont of Blomia tropicalis]|uniref:acyl-homoserine-lactone synthase n=1 Tax=Mixta mediterraneensis TaxID=2758443 RepID=UPI0025A885B7|nr:acyl-homoserine-lactone synthase [Mixta mediterraneensis]MDL4915037.1 acyl-homoserine-lactone synthase [Mixta mediterraneensis]
MLELFDVSYEELRTTQASELYMLRKQTFSDRLGWDVACSQGMESDEFDGPGTRYILGLYEGQLICSVRFAALSQPNMITHTFRDCFSTVELPEEGTESSRFFVDKARARSLLGESYPVSQVLFLAMVNWAQQRGHARIHTIVSRAMLTILRRSGWQISVLKEAHLTEKERIYLLTLPTGPEDQLQLSGSVISRTGCPPQAVVTWPLRLPV